MEYKFNDCLSDKGYPFRYDFFLPEYNTCIEYDGIQHYESIEYFGGDDKLNKTKINDNIKTNYCIDNNITLIRIPYTKFSSISEILTEIF